MTAQEDSFVDYKTLKKKSSFKFMLRYDLNQIKSHLFQHMFYIGVDPVQYYNKNPA
jgi:hypothetical protein